MSLYLAKDALIKEVESEEGEYIQNVRNSRAAYEKLVTRAEEQLAPRVEMLSQPAPATRVLCGISKRTLSEELSRLSKEEVLEMGKEVDRTEATGPNLLAMKTLLSCLVRSSENSVKEEDPKKLW